MPELKCSPSAIYQGWRSVDGSNVMRMDEDGTKTPLVLNPGANMLSADFDWGIDSPGADHLAFTVLADAFGEEEADSFYVDFKFDVVVNLDAEWRFPASHVADWLRGYLDD